MKEYEQFVYSSPTDETTFPTVHKHSDKIVHDKPSIFSQCHRWDLRPRTPMGVIRVVTRGDPLIWGPYLSRRVLITKASTLSAPSIITRWGPMALTSKLIIALCVDSCFTQIAPRVQERAFRHRCFVQYAWYSWTDHFHTTPQAFVFAWLINNSW